MKKTLLSALLPLFFCLPGYGGAEIDRNGFDKPGLPVHWKTTAGKGKPFHTKNEGRSATGAAGFEIFPDCPILQTFCFVREFPVVPGKSYRVTVYATGKGVGALGYIYLNCQVLNAEKKQLAVPVRQTKVKASAAEGVWRKLELEFTAADSGAGSGAAYGRCLFGIRNVIGGSVFFDDLSIEEL